MAKRKFYALIPRSTVQSKQLNSLPVTARWIYVAMVAEQCPFNPPFTLTYKEIREITGFSLPVISKAIKALNESGFLQYTQGGLEGVSNVYVLENKWLYLDPAREQSNDTLGRIYKKPAKPNIEQQALIDQLKKELAGERRPGSMSSDQAKHFKALKQRVISIVSEKCEIYNGNIHLVLHHKHYKSWGREDFDDVILVDGRCHALVHGKPPGLI